MIILIAIGFVLFLVISHELIHVHVYGFFIKKETLDTFLEKTLETYQLNEYDLGNLFFLSNGPYIARASSPLSKWYIHKMGTIPRWSKWNEKIENKMTELLKAYSKDD